MDYESLERKAGEKGLSTQRDKLPAICHSSCADFLSREEGEAVLAKRATKNAQLSAIIRKNGGSSSTQAYDKYILSRSKETTNLVPFRVWLSNGSEWTGFASRSALRCWVQDGSGFLPLFETAQNAPKSTQTGSRTQSADDTGSHYKPDSGVLDHALACARIAQEEGESDVAQALRILGETGKAPRGNLKERVREYLLHAC